MKRWFDGVCYYLSCMVLFNLFYALHIYSNNDIDEKCNYIFIFCLALCIVGIVTTLWMLNNDDSQNQTYVTGKKFKVLTVENQTGDNYFANFSLIVLTSISLPTNQSITTFLLLILIEIFLGTIYIKESMYYINPILTLSGYNIYKCIGIDPTTRCEYDGAYYFFVKDMNIKVGTVIKYKNINKHVIRIKNK